MSDEEEFGIGAGGPMVVEVKGRSRTPGSSRSPRRHHNDSDEYSEEEGWYDDNSPHILNLSSFK